MEHKTVKFTLKELTDAGTFEGYAAVYNVEDLGGDIIEPGAFKRSIDHKGGKFPILAAHDTTQEIGIATVEEDAKGLHVIQGKLYLSDDPREDIPAARIAYVRMKRRQEAGMPMGMSIGYETLEGPFINGKRHLKQCRLWEISSDLPFPMQPLATITAVKSHKDTSMPPIQTKNGDDGAQTFANVLQERDLWEQRYQIDSALWQSIGSIVEDDAMQPDQKLAMISTTLAQFTTALMDWARAYCAMEASELTMMQAQAHLSIKTVSYLFEAFSATATERKAGAVLNATNRATILDCITQLQALLDAATSSTTASASRHAVEAKDAPTLATSKGTASGDSHAVGDDQDDTTAEATALIARLTASMAAA